METEKLQSPQTETVAKLTKEQLATATEIRYSKDAAFIAMQDLVRTAYSIYEEKKAKLLEQEQKLWQSLYDAFDLDPSATYSIDAENRSLVKHFEPALEVITETEALATTEADHIS